MTAPAKEDDGLGRSAPAGVLRDVDWFAVAPWLLPLRCLGATLGWPLVYGAVGRLLIDWPMGLVGKVAPSRRFDPLDDPAGAWGLWIESAWRGLPVAWDDSPVVTSLVEVVRVAAWLVVGLAVVEHASRRLVDATPASPLSALRRTLRHAPSALGAGALLLASTVVLVVVLWLFGKALATPGLATIAAPFAGVVAAVVASPLSVASILLAFAAPLLAAAVGIDRADAFDALSRTVAYALQRPGTFAACIAVAALGGLGGSAAIEWLISEAGRRVAVGVANSPSGITSSIAEWSLSAFVVALRGFYPAYTFAAGAATYLVLRLQIDGQPLDEVASHHDAA